MLSFMKLSTTAVIPAERSFPHAALNFQDLSLCELAPGSKAADGKGLAERVGGGGTQCSDLGHGG